MIYEGERWFWEVEEDQAVSGLNLFQLKKDGKWVNKFTLQVFDVWFWNFEGVVYLNYEGNFAWDEKSVHSGWGVVWIEGYVGGVTQGRVKLTVSSIKKSAFDPD